MQNVVNEWRGIIKYEYKPWVQMKCNRPTVRKIYLKSISVNGRLKFQQSNQLHSLSNLAWNVINYIIYLHYSMTQQSPTNVPLNLIYYFYCCLIRHIYVSVTYIRKGIFTVLTNPVSSSVRLWKYWWSCLYVLFLCIFLAIILITFYYYYSYWAVSKVWYGPPWVLN